jgi:hypothetical protein
MAQGSSRAEGFGFTGRVVVPARNDVLSCLLAEFIAIGAIQDKITLTGGATSRNREVDLWLDGASHAPELTEEPSRPRKSTHK